MDTVFSAYRQRLDGYVLLMTVVNVACWLGLALLPSGGVRVALLHAVLFVSGMTVGLLWAKVVTYGFRMA